MIAVPPYFIQPSLPGLALLAGNSLMIPLAKATRGERVAIAALPTFLVIITSSIPDIIVFLGREVFFWVPGKLECCREAQLL